MLGKAELKTLKWGKLLMSHLGKIKSTIFAIIGAALLTAAGGEAAYKQPSARALLVYEPIHNPPRAHGEGAAIAEIKASDGFKAIIAKN